MQTTKGRSRCWTRIEKQLAELRRQEQVATQERAALAARVDALRVGLNGKDATSALAGRDGTVERTAGLSRHAGPGPVPVPDGDCSGLRRGSRRGGCHRPRCRNGCVRPSQGRGSGTGWTVAWRTRRGRADRRLARASGGAHYAVGLVEVPDQLTASVQRVLRKVAIVEDLPAAQSLIAQLPDVVAVTREGDVLSAHFAAGGSSASPTLIEVQSAIDDAKRRLTEASHACERLRFTQNQLEEQHRQASAGVEMTLARLHESDAAMAALAEELSQLSSSARSAHDEAERLRRRHREGRRGAGP